MEGNTMSEENFPIINTGDCSWSSDGKTELKICGYSLGNYPKEYKHIYTHCKNWGFFGDGAFFSCNRDDNNCPFKDIKIKE